MDATPFWQFLNENVPSGTRANDAVDGPFDTELRRYAIRAIGRIEDPANVRRLLALQDSRFTPAAEAIAQSLHGFDPQNDPRLLAEVAAALRRAVSGQPGSKSEEVMARVAALSNAMSHIAYATDGQVTDTENMFFDALMTSLSSTKYVGPYLSIV